MTDRAFTCPDTRIWSYGALVSSGHTARVFGHNRLEILVFYLKTYFQTLLRDIVETMRYFLGFLYK